MRDKFFDFFLAFLIPAVIVILAGVVTIVGVNKPDDPHQLMFNEYVQSEVGNLDMDMKSSPDVWTSKIHPAKLTTHQNYWIDLAWYGDSNFRFVVIKDRFGIRFVQIVTRTVPKVMLREGTCIDYEVTFGSFDPCKALPASQWKNIFHDAIDMARARGADI